MTLGEKLRRTRLERGLTQSQVAGSHMTRNMLSQLENDSASPSVKTLEYLAAVLEVSVGWLLGEEGGAAGAAEIADQARRLYQAADRRGCLELLQAHPEAQGEECRLLLIRSALSCGWEDFAAGRTQAAETHGKLAASACQGSLYAGPAELASANLLLARCLLQRGGDAEACVQVFQAQCKALGLEEGRHLLLARYHLSRQHTQAAERELWSVSDLSQASKAEYLLLRGKLEVQKERYRDAVLYLRQAEQEPDLPLAQQKEIFALLEQCYREQEDYKQAYAYAARQLALQ
ncbi:MAG: helix-turn-helix domain-containing protein [Candidatus Avoscillospira sp.]